MASCGSLQQIFEKPLPENPTLIESLSPWNQIKSIKPIEVSSFTEIFGELHFKENSELSSSPFPPSSTSFKGLNSQHENERIDDNNHYLSSSFLGTPRHQYTSSSKSNDGFSPKSSESLQLCTEGLGVESFDGVEESMNEKEDETPNQEQTEKVNVTKHQLYPCQDIRRSRTGSRTFPPPISSIGRTGKPWVCFKSFRHDGRFVLKEVKIPTQEFLHAFREDGRLKLHFVHPDQQTLEEDYEGDEEDEEEEEEEEEEDNENSTSKEENEKTDAQKDDKGRKLIHSG